MNTIRLTKSGIDYSKTELEAVDTQSEDYLEYAKLNCYNMASLPRSANNIDWGDSKITGDLSDLPDLMTPIDFSGCDLSKTFGNF